MLSNDCIRPDLVNLNVSIKQGKLIAVVGKVGSGKSNLLMALCGEMHELTGSVVITVNQNLLI